MGSVANEPAYKKLEEDLQVLYKEIGEVYYIQNQDAVIENEDLKALFDKVAQVNVEKKNMEIIYLARQGQKKCPNCANIVTLESRFCNMCGEKFSEESIAEIQAMIASSAPKKCVSCGVELEPDAIFCHNCGTRN